MRLNKKVGWTYRCGLTFEKIPFCIRVVGMKGFPRKDIKMVGTNEAQFIPVLREKFGITGLFFLKPAG